MLRPFLLTKQIRCCAFNRGMCNSKSSRQPDKDFFTKERDRSAVHREVEKDAPLFLRVFANKHKKVSDWYKYDPSKFTMERYKAWKLNNEIESDILSQSYIEERHFILGSDLATANFIVFRGGKVKFVGKDEWLELDKKINRCPALPDKYDKSYYLEAIDASETSLRYEGLDNFIKLSKLRWMSLRNCENVDDWFIDRMSAEFGNNLEYLDLSGCKNLTENCISCFYRFVKLKELVLEDVAVTESFQLSCLLLEEAMPQLNISGVNYIKLSSQ